MDRCLLACLFLILALAGPSHAAPTPIAELTEPALTSLAERDLAAVARYRDGMADMRAFLEQHALFTADPHLTRIPSREQKQTLREVWARYLDYTLALDALVARYRPFADLDDKDAQRQAFQVFYAAYVAQFRQALDLLAVLERNKDTHAILNEAVPALGMRDGGYSAFKLRFLHVQRATEYAAMEPVFIYHGGKETHTETVADDRRALLRYGFGEGSALTLKNGLRIIADSVGEAIFPVQAGVAEWMGDTRVYREGQPLIGAAQINELQTMLQPGDVLLERREWYLSNVGLPGYWPHAALYIGAAGERAAFFDDPAVAAWVKAQGEASGDFNALFESRLPQAFVTASGEDQGHPVRVIEAISEGVSFTSLEHSAGADAVAVLRPRIDKLAIAQSLLRALAHAGKPYDYDFDFRTDAALMCTELVFKAYHSELPFAVSKVAGRTVVSANDIARQFDAGLTLGEPAWDFVAFLDGIEKDKTAVWREEADFRLSWTRPKWHILSPPERGEVR